MEIKDASSGSAPSLSQDILLEKDNRAGMITLNRPGALNALTLDMLNALDAFYLDCMEDHHIYGIVLQSSSDTVFSTGGDLRQIYALLGESVDEAANYFRREYQHNWTLELFNKPHIALLNGIVMGGGVGISLYGTHRVGGENFQLSMPETGIGLFPDIGSSYVFSRFPGEIGVYLALTGRSIGPADALFLNVISHFIPAKHYDEIRDAMVESDPIDPILEALHRDPGEAALAGLQPWIDEAFCAETVEEILERLEGMSGAGAEWGAETAQLLRTRSPLSLKVTLRHIRRSRQIQTFREALIHDFRLTRRFLEGSDFKEGIRALLIDKDEKPVWEPLNLESVSEEQVQDFFKVLEEGELILSENE